MKWLRQMINNVWSFWGSVGTPLYDQGYAEGYKDGQEDGHEHGACWHSHPMDDFLRLSTYGKLSAVVYDDERETDRRGY